MRGKLISLFLFFLCIVLFISLVRSWLHLAGRGDIIKLTQDKLEKEKDVKEDLERRLARAQSPDYIEKQAREKLNLGREGEVVVILPKISLPPEITPTPIDNSGNWMKWAKVFL